MRTQKLIIRTALLVTSVSMVMVAFGQASKSKLLLPVPPPVVFHSEDSPEKGAHLGSQAAADVLRAFAGTDGAFLAAGLVKQDYSRDDLSTLLQYQSDELVVVTLTGKEIKQAFERSVNFYPEPNASFLQVSGFEVTFAKNPEASPRVITVTVNGSRIEDARTYTVAMPSSLGRGALGYFKIWDKSKITKTFTGQTAEATLKNKKFVETSPRWLPQG